MRKHVSDLLTILVKFERPGSDKIIWIRIGDPENKIIADLPLLPCILQHVEDNLPLHFQHSHNHSLLPQPNFQKPGPHLHPDIFIL